MNTVEKELLDKIEHGFEKCGYGNIEVAKSCLSIVEKYSVDFSDWQRELVFTENSDWLKEKTTKELYDLYLKTLL